MNPILKFFWLLLPISLLSGVGCKPKANRVSVKERVLMHTSFEELEGWSPTAQPGLTSEKAHSGRFAISVDPQHPYSATYHTTLGKISPYHRPRRITLNAWVWIPNLDADARFIVAVASSSDPEHPVFKKEVFLAGYGPTEKWKQVSRSLELPENINFDSRLVVYLWNGWSSAPVYADDLQLTELW